MIVFDNPGEIDLAVIRTFGVSVKEGDNPIGFFGTGLKIALGILLRTGHLVELQAGMARFTITTARQAVRGVEFDFVCLAGEFDSEVLGYTTDVGKTWSVDNAYRELWANNRDENGTVWQAPERPLPALGRTRFIVSGAEIEDAHANRGRFILTSEPIAVFDGIEVHAGEAGAYFYRGFRVAELPKDKKTLYTYNVTNQLDLTEDRTAKHPFMIPFWIGRAIITAGAGNRNVIETVLRASTNYIEHGLDFKDASRPPSPTFLAVVDELGSSREKLNDTALTIFYGEQRKQRAAGTATALLASDAANLRRAIELCERAGCPLDGRQVIVTDNLGAGQRAIGENGAIYVLASIVGDTRDGATVRLAGLILRAWVDIEHGNQADTVAFLIGKLLAQVKP